MEKRIRLILLTIAVLVLATATATAQRDYKYAYHTQRITPIDWKPEAKFRQQYTITVHPFHLLNRGLKFDFEYQLPDPSQWLQVGLSVCIAPRRNERYSEYEGYSYGYGSTWSTLNSDDYDYNHMWSVGASVLFKKMFHPRGWYFATGLMFNFYRVGHDKYNYLPYKEDGLTLYEPKTYSVTTSFFKPSAQFNMGKHFSLSKRVFIDAFMGLSFSYSLFDRSYSPSDSNNKYNNNWGFAYRGLSVNAGLRIGVLLWDN